MDTLRAAGPEDQSAILEVINDGASAYRGVIPADCWHEPYMSARELTAEIAAGVAFTVLASVTGITAVMGIQDRVDVSLIRHAYVATHAQRQGCGSQLLRHLLAQSGKPFLIGTWAAATWAIDFYLRHGFYLVGQTEKDELLDRYWNVPQRQAATSVVLAESRFRDS